MNEPESNDDAEELRQFKPAPFPSDLMARLLASPPIPKRSMEVDSRRVWGWRFLGGWGAPVVAMSLMLTTFAFCWVGYGKDRAKNKDRWSADGFERPFRIKAGKEFIVSKGIGP